MSCVLSFLRGRVLCCAGAVLFSLGFLPRAPTQKKQKRALWEATPKFVCGAGARGYLHWWKRWDAYCIVNSTTPLSFLAFVHSRFRVLGFPPGLLGNGNDTTACGHPFSQFLLHVAASRPVLD